MRDFFFQIVLFLAGAIMGIAIPFLEEPEQKRVLKILAMLFIGASLVWIGYEVGVNEFSSAINPAAGLNEFTQTSTSDIQPNLSPSVSSIHTRLSDGMTMVFVGGGEFYVGSEDNTIDYVLQICNAYGLNCERDWFEDEMPVHSVLLKNFWIDRTEVTNAQYRKCVEAEICQVPKCLRGKATYDDISKENYPVVCVDWYDAQTYCKWVGARLPTEIEWEYAARGPDRNYFPWGNTFDGKLLNFCDANCRYDHKVASFDDGYERTAPVGSYESGASWCGALDMAGNAWEWTSSLYKDYPYQLDDGREDSASPDNRVLRGGCWNSDPPEVHSTNRSKSRPENSDGLRGFRCLTEIED